MGDFLLFLGLTGEYSVFNSPQKEKTRQFIQHLKVLEENIVSRDFDFPRINSRIEEFGRKHYMSQKTVNRLLAIFEEMAVQTILPLLPEEMKMTVLIEYSEEKDEATMYLRYNGEKCDPTRSDELSMVLVRNSAEQLEFSYHTGEEMPNEIMIVCKP